MLGIILRLLGRHKSINVLFLVSAGVLCLGLGLNLLLT